MLLDDLQSRILDGIDRLAIAQNAQAIAAKAHAELEHAYRQEQAKYFLIASTAKHEGKPLTVEHKKAVVDEGCSDAMLRAKLAEAERESATLLVKTLMTQLSALQTLINGIKSEADAVRYGQAGVAR